MEARNSLPVCSNLGASGDCRRLLARAETGAVGVASEVGVGGVSEGVVGVPLALNTALASGGIVRLEPVARDQQALIVNCPRQLTYPS